jgi:hypothetical protein
MAVTHAVNEDLTILLSLIDKMDHSLEFSDADVVDLRQAVGRIRQRISTLQRWCGSRGAKPSALSPGAVVLNI